MKFSQVLNVCLLFLLFAGLLAQCMPQFTLVMAKPINNRNIYVDNRIDNFDRDNSKTLGGDWLESNLSQTDVCIENQQLVMNDTSATLGRAAWQYVNPTNYYILEMNHSISVTNLFTVLTFLSTKNTTLSRYVIAYFVGYPSANKVRFRVLSFSGTVLHDTNWAIANQMKEHKYKVVVNGTHALAYFDDTLKATSTYDGTLINKFNLGTSETGTNFKAYYNYVHFYSSPSHMQVWARQTLSKTIQGINFSESYSYSSNIGSFVGATWSYTPKIIDHAQQVNVTFLAEGSTEIERKVLTLNIYFDFFNDHLNYYSKNPVLNRGTVGKWDYYDVRDNYVIKLNNGTYAMFYTGNNGITGGVGLALSNDNGVTWTKYKNNPLFTNGTGRDWDNKAISYGNVIKMPNGTWYAYYSGKNQTIGNKHWAIGLVTSNDLVTWTKYSGNPLFTIYNTPFVDNNMVLPYVVRDKKGTYHMYWEGDRAGWTLTYANSSDGVTWGNFRTLTSALMIEHGWDKVAQANPKVYCLRQDMWLLTYNGYYSGAVQTYNIGLAVSEDGLNWNRFVHPLLYRNQSGRLGWDEQAIEGLTFLVDESGSLLLTNYPPPYTIRGWYFGRTYPGEDCTIGMISIQLKADFGTNSYIYTPNELANLVTVSFSDPTLTFTVSAPSGTTSTTKVYCGDKGEPKTVNGATSWSYNSLSNILTITTFHLSSITIVVVSWSLDGWSPLGDINDDGTVDTSDLFVLSQAFGSTGGPPPSPDWNSDADLNKDNNINILDLYIWSIFGS